MFGSRESLLSDLFIAVFSLKAQPSDYRPSFHSWRVEGKQEILGDLKRDTYPQLFNNNSVNIY